jgi:predicted Zn-dependent protease
MSGRLRQSYRALATAASRQAASEESTVWVQGQLGEMAMRLGEFTAAQTHWRAALRIRPDDPWLLAMYADLLLLQNQPEDVLRLLRGYEAQDALLLRLAIAGMRGGAPEAARWTTMLDARRRAARADADPHLREHARFELDVLGRPQQALELARRNWAVQREPADVAVYLRAARAAGAAADQRTVADWIREVGYEDAMLEGLAAAPTQKAVKL